MSIRHYGMKQCFTQYLNLILRVSPRPRRPGDAAGSAKVGGNKVNPVDRKCPPPTSTPNSPPLQGWKKKEKSRRLQERMLRWKWKCNKRVLLLMGFYIAGPAVRVPHQFHTNPNPAHLGWFFFKTCKTWHHAHTRSVKKQNSTARAGTPRCHTWRAIICYKQFPGG